MNNPALFLCLSFILGSTILYLIGGFLLIFNTYYLTDIQLDNYLCKNSSESYCSI